MVQKCCKRYSTQRDNNISVCSMEVGVLEVWNDIVDTESESEVSNEESVKMTCDAKVHW